MNNEELAAKLTIKELTHRASVLESQINDLLAMRDHLRGEYKAMEKNRDRMRAEFKEVKAKVDELKEKNPSLHRLN